MRYIIRGQDAETKNYVFWSNTYGWTSEASLRDYFSENERNSCALPTLTDMIEKISWVPVF